MVVKLARLLVSRWPSNESYTSEKMTSEQRVLIAEQLERLTTKAPDGGVKNFSARLIGRDRNTIGRRNCGESPFKPRTGNSIA